MVTKKSLGTLICELTHFQSFISSLAMLHACKIHFMPDGIVIHSTEAANVAFVILNYKVDIATPLSIMVDLTNIKGIKSDAVQIYQKDNNLVFHDDGLIYNCASLADPNVERRDREGPVVKWDHIDISLSNDQIKKVLTILNAKNKYDFTLAEGTLTINDATDNDREYNIEVASEASFTTRVHGMYLADILMATKWFEGCTLTLGNDTPFRLHYSNEWMQLEFFVAPMIDKGK